MVDAVSVVSMGISLLINNIPRMKRKIMMIKRIQKVRRERKESVLQKCFNCEKHGPRSFECKKHGKKEEKLQRA